MSKKHYLVIIPGLGDNDKKFNFVVRNWEKEYKIIPHIHLMPWKDKRSFTPKLKRLLLLIDNLYKNGNEVSLLGTSAGGSAVINAFCKRKNKISKVINVCGRLREGKNVFPTLRQAAMTSPSFEESVLLCEANLEKLSKKDKSKIMTIKPLFDEVVPGSTVAISGANNAVIFSVEHIVSIVLAVTLYSKKIMEFLRVTA